MSQRPEFLRKIAPGISYNNDGIYFHFNMFSQGKQVPVTVDDALPFDENNSLVYASSVERDSLLLSSFFEKAFVKLACWKYYQYSIATRPVFVFSCFSDSLVSYRIWKKEEAKQNLMDDLKLEVENKSSVVLGVTPSLNVHPRLDGYGHAYAVMDYNHEYKALKLYDPRCDPDSCVTL